MRTPIFRYKGLTIRSKLLTVGLCLLILPIITLGIVSYQSSKQESNALIERDIKNNVHFAMELMGSLQDGVERGDMTELEAQEKFKKIILGKKDREGHRPINKEIDLGENGYFYVLDAKGSLLAHPLLEGQNIWDKQTSDGQFYIQELIAKAQDGGGSVFYNWPLPKTDDKGNAQKEALKIVYADQDPKWGWVIAAGSYMQDFNQGQIHILKMIMITLVICLLVGTGILTIFARHVSRPIRSVTLAAERIARGDLTGESLYCENRDESGRLVQSFNQLQTSLHELITSISVNADTLSHESDRQAQVLKESIQGAGHTADSIIEIASMNENQARNLHGATRAIGQASEGIVQLAATSTQSYDASEESMKEAEQGNEHLHQSLTQMNQIASTVEGLSTTISALHGQSSEIDEIVQMIREIADQTHLLALNASIEAARAGDYGQGFAVVAAEIRKLAERSNQSAAQISEVIIQVQQEVELAKSSMDQGKREFGVAVSAIQETSHVFVRILEAGQRVVEQCQEAATVSEQISGSSREVAISMQEMERMSQQTAKASQTVSATTEEQLASMEEISQSSERLHQMAEELREMAGQFKI
ncbi:methyl-accepting chemotaxis protein [Paenibacillus terrigena]|uniref:methyl-accepting chemotaxis protein n=1 Tax=Paenibacillus terrigena TaxID=369333 RepID=UPI00037D35CA|nr:methyl-accepting chemotaxis protein [Paenibacillus terrigena]